MSNPTPNAPEQASPESQALSLEPSIAGSLSVAPPARGNTLLTGDSKVGTQPQSQVSPAPQFKTLGRYKILGELGRGGMGAVYLAEDTVLKRKVALKIPQFEPRKEEQMRARFIREAQLAAQLTHPNICQIYDVGVIDGQLVMAMEYIEGRDLAAFTKPDKLMSARAAVGLVKKIALAVDVAHQKGLVHRDLKPSNIMLSQPDKSKKTVEPKVMDFGLAKSLESTGKQLTHSGMIVGTPCYMSKEQWSGREGQLGPASDVFSLGVILYELLTGQLPYDSDDGEPATAWFVKLVTQPQFLPSERKPGVDPGLEAIVMRSIAKEPEDRYINMAEFAAALAGWIKGKPLQASQSLMDPPFDEEMVALIEQKPKRTTNSPRKPPGSIPSWLPWTGAGGAVVLLLGIALLFSGQGDTTSGTVNGKLGSAVTPPGSLVVSMTGTMTGDSREIPLPSGVKMNQVWCPPGTFTMGTPGATDDEAPVQVTLTKGYWLGQTEVTQAQWTAVMGPASKPWSGKTFVKEGPTFPASCISHGVNPDGTIEADSATAYCEKLTEIERKAGRLPTGWKYALPTEAQWEYACRAGTLTKYSFGDDESKLSEHAWWGGIFGDGNAKTEKYAHAVGTKHPNPWGLSDMHGNLWEWCRDGYADKLLGGSDQVNTGTVDRRVLRGGSWDNNTRDTRSDNRGGITPGIRYNSTGFRVATVPDATATPELQTIEKVIPTAAWNENKPGDSRELTLPSGEKMKLVWCPPGTFTMGSPASEPGREDDENPVEVTLSYGFWLGQTETTQEQWTAVMGTTPWAGLTYFKEGPNFPAFNISHKDAESYCEKLTETERQAGRLPTGWKYALPTEAQWEYACRAGTKSSYSFGNDESSLGEYAWFGKNADNIGEQYAHAVGMKKTNPWGFCDMHGNVWEWCRDGYAEKLPGGAAPLNYGISGLGALRGGSWRENATASRSANRIDIAPDIRGANSGFRVATVPSMSRASDPQASTNELPSPNSQPIPSPADSALQDGEVSAAVTSVEAESTKPQAEGKSRIPADESVSLSVGPLKSPSNMSIEKQSGDSQEVTLPGGVKLDTQKGQMDIAVGQAGEVRVITKLNLSFCWCPLGEFTMGTVGARSNEKPAKVILSRGFWMAQTEVTQKQWFAVMRTRPWSALDQSSLRKGDKFPAVAIDYFQATAFCDKLTETETANERIPIGWKLALPTEAQWEYACRAGTQSSYSFGDDEADLATYGWYASNLNGQHYAHVVATKKSNPWGLYDMHGNVWEWCRDGYQRNLPGGPDPYVSPTSPGAPRIDRGGGWSSPAKDCRSADRSWPGPTFSINALGFRLAMVSDKQ